MTDFWRDLTGPELMLNLHGDPPYDVVKAATYIATHLGLPVGPVLEIGCGLGRLQRVMVECGYNVIGIDVNPVALRACRHAGLNVDHAVGDGSIKIYREANLLNGAYSVTVFQHLPEDVQRRYLAELARVLKPGARAVIQHVVGAERGPQSRQVTKLEWARWCYDAGLALDDVEPDPIQPDWTWFTMEKPA